MADHTPGPWAVLSIRDDIFIADDKRAHLATMRNSVPETRANARLIAAAPDLLEALQKIDDWLVCACIASADEMAESFPYMQQVVSAAIARATGEK